MTKLVVNGYALNYRYKPLLNMQISHEDATAYGPLTQRINALLSRENLTTSIYLSKFITAALTFPLHALAHQRTVAQITSNRDLIRRAVQESRLANVVGENQVQLIAYPTIKLGTGSEEAFKELQSVLSQLQKQYCFSRRSDDEYINLTLYEEDSAFLQQLMTSLSHPLLYQPVTLYDDIRAGTAASKHQKHHKHIKKHYSLERPPQIFIRRAVDSEEEEPEHDNRKETKEKQQKNEKQEGRRKYREVVRECGMTAKPTFSNEDFPLLS